jgi:hypothetical protein
MTSSTTRNKPHPKNDISIVGNSKIRIWENRSSAIKLSELQSETVSRCLTDDCKDCTGSYTSELLHHRLLCLCLCHKRGEAGSVGGS